MAGGWGFSPPVQSREVPSASKAFFLSGFNGFSGERTMLSFEDVRLDDPESGQTFFRSLETMEDDLDGYLQQPDKKRRLTADQVEFLEKSFELENKLEPERKVQLAKDLGLQPRQIAIWFQNRRARWKTKQLEKDFDTLQASYNALKADYDALVKETDQLRDQVRDLADELRHEGKQVETSALTSKTPQGLVQIPITQSVSGGGSKTPNTMPTKHEEICSAKSDVLDSDSPHYADCSHSSQLEPGDASYVFEPDQSDISQDEEDSLMPTHIMFENNFAGSPAAAPCGFQFPADDPGFWSWPY